MNAHLKETLFTENILHFLSDNVIFRKYDVVYFQIHLVEAHAYLGELWSIQRPPWTHASSIVILMRF